MIVLLGNIAGLNNLDKATSHARIQAMCVAVVDSYHCIIESC